MKKKYYYKKQNLNGREIYIYNDELMNSYKNLSNYLSRIWSIKTKSRNNIIKDIKACLSNGNRILIDGDNYLTFSNERPTLIIRGDIHHFFSSVNKQIIYKKIMEKDFLSIKSIKLIKNIIFDKSVKGLPQGNPLSSVLSEIYLKEFDNFINLKFEPIVYERFVDDFIIVLSGDEFDLNIIKNYISEKLKDLNLCLSDKKFSITNISEPILKSMKEKDFPKKYYYLFDFLGYEFSLLSLTKSKMIGNSNLSSNKEKRLLIVNISISDGKLKKYKYKLNKYFLEYKKSKKSNRFWILKYKVENVFCGVITLDSKNNIQKIGLPYGYSEVNNYNKYLQLYGEVVFLCKKYKFNNSKRSEIMKDIHQYSNIKNYNFNIKNRIINYNSMNLKILFNILGKISLTYHKQNILKNKAYNKKFIIKKIFSIIYGNK